MMHKTEKNNCTKKNTSDNRDCMQHAGEKRRAEFENGL